MSGESEVDPALAALAGAGGVATLYVAASGRRVAVARDVVVRVLAALGVEAGTPAAVRAAQVDLERRRRQRLLPPAVVVRQSAPRPIQVHGPLAATPRLRAELEDGTTRELPPSDPPVESRTNDGAPYAAWSLPLPSGLPLGWHRLAATASDRTATATLIVTPDRLELPTVAGGQVWGWSVQLYALRSARSWGMGDLGDLAELARWSGGELGAGLLLCNPLHAVAPVRPIQASPYFPSSRRFWNPLYLRIEELAEYRAADRATKDAVDRLGLPPDGDRIDRDAAWQAKSAAWELLWPLAAGSERLRRFRAERGSGLEDFARFCALADRFGLPWQAWPTELHRPEGPAVARLAEQLADRVALHAWLQLCCEEQLAAAQAAALGSGMPIGILHDLAVGSDPGGADAWALPDLRAADVSIGAPPDEFNPTGQDWGLPPWRPDRLAEQGYGPYAELLRSVLRFAGGVRIDHVLGLFRQWWVPAGEPPSRGTYVRYDDEAMLGVLALEAHRAGALVVGEDLGTVEPRVRAALQQRGILGSAVLWFERDEDGRPLPPTAWPALAAASVSTHDLPTAAGFLAGESFGTEPAPSGRSRSEVTEPVPAQSVADQSVATGSAASERAELLNALRAWGLLEENDAAEFDAVLAMYALLRRTPCPLVLAALADAVGDPRRANLPGTTTEYPNWRLPLARPGTTGPRPVRLEELLDLPAVRRLAQVLND